MNKKFYLLIVAVFMALTVRADYSGICGDNLTWYLNTTTKTLTISGAGSMYNYYYDNLYYYTFSAPWYDYNDYVENVVIEEGVTTIGDAAFNCCWRVKSMVLPSTLKHIGNGAFYMCSFTTIELPESLRSIGKKSFGSCTDLAIITLPNSLEEIGEFAFDYCRDLRMIVIPASVTSIGRNPLRHCTELTSIIVDANNALYDSRDNSFSIIETATNTLVSACKNTRIPNTVTAIGDFAYQYLEIETVDIPDSVISIGEQAFDMCDRLKTVNLGKSVTTIRRLAFSDCTMLHTLTLPKSVTTIYAGAFSDCSYLESFYCLATVPPECMDVNAFYDVDRTIPFYVPFGCVNAYRNDEVWSIFTNITELPENYGLDEQEAIKVSIYPNPASACINVEGDNIRMIEVLTVDGKILQTFNMSDDFSKSVDLAGLKNGLYLMRITNKEGKTTTESFIKE